ncbi:MAG TPA: DMT family transporter [Anaerolineales bacterium]|nr:DMT family transporter [Anaerolineales bacterium]
MRLKADLSLLMVSIVWGIAFLSQYYAATFSSIYLFNGFGFLIASILLFLFKPNKEPIPTQQWIWMAVAGFVLFIASALQQIGIFTTDLANAGFLTSLYTVFTPFVLLVFFKEKPALLDVIAVFVAVLGAFLLSTGGKMTLHVGDIYETIGAIFWALHIVILGKFASRYNAFTFSAGQFLFGAVLNLVVGFLIEDPGVLLEPLFLGSLAFRSIFSISIGYTFQVWGQQHTPPTDAALILSLEAVFASITGWVVLSQILSPLQIIGCLVIFGAVLLSQLKLIIPKLNPSSNS